MVAPPNPAPDADGPPRSARDGAPPTGATPFADVPFVVVDVETTGGSPRFGDRITEVAAVSVHRGVVADEFHTLVNPGRPIPWHITRITGIDDAMVRDAPRFDEIAGELASALIGRVFVAHNARFDWGFLTAEYDRLTATPLDAIAGTQLCTVRLARRLLAHLPRRNLDSVAWHYGVTIDGRHRAAGDARATAAVLLGLLRDAERRDIHTLEALHGWLAGGSAAGRRRRSALPRPSDGAGGA